ncbi:polycomb group protein Psc-like [Hetaerina americana]|uniref:polycomb group protein Psc-like n=1 Tax=Hetaerina americana TaxID=62018 RepID=UPI003A7F5030
MNRPSRLKLSDVNPNLICVLCGGYFIDATTIVECLHSFCKTCIVRYLETSKYCPICDVQVHKTKPLQNIRADHTLQNIVYKLVPGLYQNEMKQRQEFYACHPEVPPTSEYDAGAINEETSCIYCPDETVALCLEYSGKASSSLSVDGAKLDHLFPPLSKDCHPHRRYFRCPAAVTVSHLKKLLRSKYGVSADHRVDIMYNDELLKEEYSLMDVAYIYLWKRKGFMRFTYRIFEWPHKRRRLDHERYKTVPNFVMDAAKSELLGNVSEIKAVEDRKQDSERLVHDQVPSVSELNVKASEMTKANCDTCVDRGGTAVSAPSGEEWKEVQLQISENGIMSVRNMDDLVSAVEGGLLSGAFNETVISSGKAEENGGELGKSELDNAVPAGKEGAKSSGKIKEIPKNCKGATGDDQKTMQCGSAHPEDAVVKSVSPVENNYVSTPSTPTLPAKTIGLDRTSGLRACASGVRFSFPKKELSSKPKDMNNKEMGGEIGASMPSLECLSPLNSCPQPCTTRTASTVTPNVSLTPIPPSVVACNSPPSPAIPKRSNSAPVGYKTLKTPPKTWNPSIPRARVLANHSSFGKSNVGNLNGNIGLAGQSTPSKADGRMDGKVNSVGVEGAGCGAVRLPPTSSPKPLRFFKIRNNMPRYLGNPSSGVKPMYSVHPGAGGGVAPVTPKPSLPSPKVDLKASPAAPPLATSTSIECKVEKSPTLTTKVAFPVTPMSRSSHKPPSGATTTAAASHPPPSPPLLLQTPPVVASHASSAQLPMSRTTTTTTQSMPPPISTMSSSGYHPSLPPIISMKFGQSRSTPAERALSQTPPPPPPAVQRVPASLHNFHHPVTPIHLLQHRQTPKTPGKLNGEISNGSSGGDARTFAKSEKSIDGPPVPKVASPPPEALKAKAEPSREVAKKEPVNGQIEGNGVPALIPPPPVVDGKSMAPSKC